MPPRSTITVIKTGNAPNAATSSAYGINALEIGAEHFEKCIGHRDNAIGTTRRLFGVEKPGALGP